MTRDVLVTVLLLSSFAAAPALAQQTDPDDLSSQAKVQIGPLGLSPSIALTNAGVDNNVFNDPSDAQPKSDFTMTIEPRTDAWLHIGRSLVIGNVTEDLVYYQKYTNQRSANNIDRIGLLVPLTRIRLAGNVKYLNATDRPGFEIDARVHHVDVTMDGSVEVRALSRTFVGVKATRTVVDYDQGDEFAGANLQDELNSTTVGGSATLRLELTPLTSLIFDGGKEQDRFAFDNLRDSNSTTINAGVKFSPFALLKGTARFGYRNFEPLVSGLPAYKGPTAAVDLSYVALGVTKVTLTALRDIEYSYDVLEPYYVQTGGELTVSQEIFGPIDVVGRVGLQSLAYRDRVGIPVPDAGRTDTVHSYGGGVGYHMAQDVRFGVNIDQINRVSAVADRNYNDLRFGASVTYGF